ncbi:MAG TPA: hypothetical protein VGM98_11115 [Schlesneria sp.]
MNALTMVPNVETSPCKSRWRVLTSAVTVPAAAGIAALLEAGSQSLRLTIVLTTAVALATSLGSGLYLSAQAFRQAVQQSRRAVHTSTSPLSLSRRLQTASRNSRSVPQQLQRDFNAVRQLLKAEIPSGDQRTSDNN